MTHPRLRMDTAVLNWPPLRFKSSSSVLRRAWLRFESRSADFFSYLYCTVVSYSRDRRPVQIVEQVQHPETGHQRHVKTPDDLLLQLAPVGDTESLNLLLRVGEMAAALELLGVLDIFENDSWSLVVDLVGGGGTVIALSRRSHAVGGPGRRLLFRHRCRVDDKRNSEVCEGEEPAEIIQAREPAPRVK